MNILCEDLDEPDVSGNLCDYQVIIDEDLYGNLESSSFEFVNAEIIDDCLNIELGASGCDGANWEFKLVDSGSITESSPEQRFLKLQLINIELCDAFFQTSISFDLKPIRIENGINEIILNIDGLQSALNYTY
ncbi:hypothetical protein DIS18_07605 [Algibacter marinivivus]|uniref:Uncharacterized protein n=2 Tax=Algibacter marinivivus TaxID=2100723 RepID=A0A2U2X9H5_9FLAO|nr:hypothetical protein DIS18_07605 [Algibacter marinivivus]